MGWQLTISGFVVGTFVGAVGMGGGSLLTPLLVVFFGFNPATAVGTDILHGAIFKTVGALRHRRLGTVEGRLSAWMLLGSAPMSLVGVAIATWLKHRAGPSGESLEGLVVGAALVAGGLGLAAKAVFRFRETPAVPLELSGRDRVAAVLIGLGGGLIVGMTSVGSGVFFGLTMLVVFRLRSQKVVGTDIAHAAALLWVAGIGHAIAGNVDVRAVAWLLVGSVPGVLLGANASVRIPARTLRVVMSATLVASGIKLLDIPEASGIALACLGGGIVAAVLLERRPIALESPMPER